jgi:hypothetical protein
LRNASYTSGSNSAAAWRSPRFAAASSCVTSLMAGQFHQALRPGDLALGLLERHRIGAVLYVEHEEGPVCVWTNSG